MNFNELADKAHSNAVNHGFWDEKWSNEHCLMLVITEIGEMVEAHRKGHRADVDAFVKYDERIAFDENFERHVKDTVEDEFADIAIRLFDLAGALGVDFDKMNPCRYHRAFDKFDFAENAFALCKGLARDGALLPFSYPYGGDPEYARGGRYFNARLPWRREQCRRRWL